VSVLVKRYGIQAALVGVAAVWGGTFVMVKDAVAHYPLYAFLAWRFAIAVIAFVVLFPRAVRRLNADTLRWGVLAGTFLTAGYIFQTWGLQSTTSSKAAFITGMFVVMTPALQALLMRRVPRVSTIAGASLAVVGLWLLSGAGGGAWNVGDTRVALCALAYSFHMIVLGSAGDRHDVGALTLVQLTVTAVVCGGVSLVTEHPGPPSSTSVWVALLVTGVLASAVAFAVQTYAQRSISPARTALILITEPAFGGVFGWIAGDVLGVRGFAGAALILTGMVSAEIVAARAPREEGVVLEVAIEGPSVPFFESAEERV
jgi:drug/metabolite transporter (DMT)-like permease